MKWTPEEDELIKGLRAEGFTAREITVRMDDRTESAVRERLRVIAKTRRSWSEEEKLEAFWLKSQGLGAKEIGLSLGRTAAAINSFFARHGDAEGWENYNQKVASDLEKMKDFS